MIFLPQNGRETFIERELNVSFSEVFYDYTYYVSWEKELYY